MDIKDITPEQCEKIKACKTSEELVALAKEEGCELTEEQLDAISGGSWCDWDDCSDVKNFSNNEPCPGVIY